VFVSELFFSLVGSFTLLFFSSEVVDHINEWTTGIPKYTDTKKIASFVRQQSLLIGALTIFHLGFYITDLIGYRECNDLLTIFIFRGLFANTRLYFAPYFRFLSFMVVLFHIYILYCSRSVIFLPVLFAKCIINLATEWKRRLTMLLGTSGILML